MKAPTTTTMLMACGAYSIHNGKRRAICTTPATTIVAAWMSAETGVGPSMASGSHIWRGNMADLPAPPMNMRTRAVGRMREPVAAARDASQVVKAVMPSASCISVPVNEKLNEPV